LKTINRPVPLGQKNGIFRLCVLHVVFFDIIVDNEREFDLCRCRYFLGHRITPNIRDSPRKPIWAFSAQFPRLSALLFLFLSCMSMKH